MFGQYFIAAKIQRGLNGILDFDGGLDEQELSDPQSDANGSIKIALVAFKRSIAAWAALMTDENSQTIAPLIRLLETVKNKAEEKFPSASDFTRPGFDELETIA